MHHRYKISLKWPVPELSVWSYSINNFGLILPTLFLSCAEAWKAVLFCRDSISSSCKPHRFHVVRHQLLALSATRTNAIANWLKNEERIYSSPTCFRKFPSLVHRREGIWFQGQQVSQNHPRFYVPGINNNYYCLFLTLIAN